MGHKTFSGVKMTYKNGTHQWNVCEVRKRGCWFWAWVLVLVLGVVVGIGFGVGLLCVFPEKKSILDDFIKFQVLALI